MAEGQNTVDEKESTAGRDEESLSCGNSAETNLEKKTSEEYSENVNPSDQMNVTAEEPVDHEPAEAETGGRRGENIRSVDDENGIDSGKNKNEGWRKENGNTLSGEESVEKTDDPEAEKTPDVRSGHEDTREADKEQEKATVRSMSGAVKSRKIAKKPEGGQETGSPEERCDSGRGLPKICVPLTGTGKDELEAQAREAAAASPDLVEWRADYFEDLGDVEKGNRGCLCPSRKFWVRLRFSSPSARREREAMDS